MNKKYTASMLSEGNHLFQASITVTDDGLKMKIPNFWKNKETFFRYEDISGFRVDTPSWYTVLSYCTIHLNARGTWVEAHGFTKSDAQKIKRYIEEGQNGNNGSSSSNTSRGREEETYEEWSVRSTKEWKETLAAVGQFAEEQRAEYIDLIEKIKRALTKSLQLFYLYNYDEDKIEADKMQLQIKERKKYLLRYLRKIGEENQYELILEECRNSARVENDRRIAEINEGTEAERASLFEGIR
jgi:hypothetical protein